MAVRRVFLAASASAILALALAVSANAQAPAAGETVVRPESGTAVESGRGVRLLGGTVCLPGTGMFFYSGPPERHDVVKDRGGDDSPAVEPASESTSEPAKSGAAESGAGADVR